MINFKKLFKNKTVVNDLENRYRITCKIYYINTDVTHKLSYTTDMLPEDIWGVYRPICDWLMNETSECFLIKHKNIETIINRSTILTVTLKVIDQYSTENN